jgi:hypothetical protein
VQDDEEIVKEICRYSELLEFKDSNDGVMDR